MVVANFCFKSFPEKALTKSKRISITGIKLIPNTILNRPEINLILKSISSLLTLNKSAVSFFVHPVAKSHAANKAPTNPADNTVETVFNVPSPTLLITFFNKVELDSTLSSASLIAFSKDSLAIWAYASPPSCLAIDLLANTSANDLIAFSTISDRYSFIALAPPLNTALTPVLATFLVAFSATSSPASLIAVLAVASTVLSKASSPASVINLPETLLNKPLALDLALLINPPLAVFFTVASAPSFTVASTPSRKVDSAMSLAASLNHPWFFRNFLNGPLANLFIIGLAILFLPKFHLAVLLLSFSITSPSALVLVPLLLSIISFIIDAPATTIVPKPIPPNNVFKILFPPLNRELNIFFPPLNIFSNKFLAFLPLFLGASYLSSELLESLFSLK